MSAAAHASQSGGIARIQAELRARDEALTSLVEPGESCALCESPGAVTLLHLAVPDPDANAEVTMVDAPTCATCASRFAPRVIVKPSPDLARRLIQSAAIDVEAYPRLVITPTRPIRIEGGDVRFGRG